MKRSIFIVILLIVISIATRFWIASRNAESGNLIALTDEPSLSDLMSHLQDCEYFVSLSRYDEQQYTINKNETDIDRALADILIAYFSAVRNTATTPCRAGGHHQEYFLREEVDNLMRRHGGEGSAKDKILEFAGPFGNAVEYLPRFTKLRAQLLSDHHNDATLVTRSVTYIDNVFLVGIGRKRYSVPSKPKSTMLLGKAAYIEIEAGLNNYGLLRLNDGSPNGSIFAEKHFESSDVANLYKTSPLFVMGVKTS